MAVASSSVAVASSSNANLNSLVVSSSTDNTTFSALALTPSFAGGTTAYAATVANDVTHVKVTASADDHRKATVKVDKGSTLTPLTRGAVRAVIALTVGANAIGVEVTAEDGTKKTYTVTVTHRATNAAATGKPSISGTAREGQTLTAGKGSIADADGVTKANAGEAGYAYTYQWINSDGIREWDIIGAWSKTHVLAGRDVGAKVKVRIAFTDDAGYAESRTSDAYPSSGTVEGLSAPAAPTDLTATRDGRFAIDLAWTAPVASATRLPVAEYEIEWSATGEDDGWMDLTTVKRTVAHKDSDLNPGTTRYYRVRALGVSMHSPWSNTASATTDASNTAPTVVSGSTGYYSDVALSNALTGPRKAGANIYTKVTFSEDMKHTKSNEAAARPELFHRIGAEDTQYDILDPGDTLATGDCKPNHATETDEYICLYAVGSSVNGAFAVKAGTNSVDKANNALAAAYTHATTLTLDTVKPGIEFPSDETPTAGTAVTITLTDATAKVARYAVLQVGRFATDATGCDDPAEATGDDFSTVEVDPAASSHEVSYTPVASSKNKKVCVYAEDAAGNRHAALWTTDVVVAPPAAPEGFWAAAGDGALTLHWSDPSDAAITGYQYQIKEAKSRWDGWEDIPDSGAATTSHTVDGLANGTAYTLRVRAVDGGGAGAESKYVSATPGVSALGNVLTARAHFSTSAAHPGSGKSFKVTIAFSEPVMLRAKEGAKTLKVTGGTVKNAKSANGRTLWIVRIEAASDGAVSVTLPATKSCGAEGAVCTADGRPLSTPLTVTVGSPLTISVADARAKEGEDESIDFTVMLSRAASEAVTVGYSTRDGTATKDDDYRLTRGTLIFAPGETAKTVSVAVLDDAHDEGAETFRLVLKGAQGAAIADGEATGTITNADPLQQVWLARFGRAAASDAIAAVTARFETPRGAGSHLTLAGQRLSGDGAALADTVAGLARAFGAEEAPAAAIDDPFARHGLGDPWNDPASAPGRTMSTRELLMGTSFRAVLGQGAGLQWTAWGQGASVSQFSGAVSGLSLTGESATGSMGMDYERGRLLTGFALTHSLGEGTAHGAGRSYVMGSAVTTMLPYARFALTERVSAWGLAGTGTGELTLDLDGAASERYGADLSMTLGAAGVRGDLVTPVEAGGFALAVKADAFWVRTESDAVSSPGAGNLAAARADATRLRAVLDGSRTFSLARGATLTPSVALGVRQDGGDAETGRGFELGAGLGYADPSRGLDMALRVHALGGHAEDGYREWGVSGSLRLEPGGSGRGLSMSLTPSYGVDPGGSERLWAMPDATALAANGDAVPASRLDTEVGYGLGGPGGRGVVTPYAALGLAGDDARTWRAGARWQLAPDATLGLEGTRSESGADPAEHGLMVRSAVRW